ncbi:MAG: riboflavin synthase [Gammaproteobacteria bacterium]
MFTGIIQAIGKINEIKPFGADVRLEINANTLPMQDVKIGDSIAVNGACLTVVALHPPYIQMDASVHTLEKTTLGKMRVGQKVNLEKCLQLNSYLGGHLVSGHVDGIAQLVNKQEVARAQELTWRVPPNLLAYIAVKGSIALNGISLTVNSVEEDRVGVTIIPHTNENTTLNDLKIGEEANIEIDLIARYVARWLGSKEEINNKEKWSQLLGNL